MGRLDARRYGIEIKHSTYYRSGVRVIRQINKSLYIIDIE